MLRLSKLADYAVVVMTAAARAAGRGSRLSAAQVAAETGIPAPTVAKIMGTLARADLLVSQRGVAGGFELVRNAATISLADIIEAIDGPITLTHCSDGAHDCRLTGHCAVKPHWDPVNRAVKSALSGVSLAALLPSSKVFA